MLHRHLLVLGLAGISAALQTQYQANGGVLYREHFLSPADFEAVQRECRSLRGQMRAEKDSIARRRLGVCLDRKSLTHAKLMSADIAAKLARLTGVERLEPSEFPAELRHYGDGSMMDWHQDDVLYDPPQTEVILTLENSADCFTEWIGPDGERECVWTEPNSVLLVRAGAGGPSHRVTRVKRGERTIVKCVFHAPGCEKTPSFYDHINSFPGAQKSVAERARALAAKAKEADRPGRRGRGERGR
eukprot:scaffold10998_cov112-Isochrysis_galbana.AAC.2